MARRRSSGARSEGDAAGLALHAGAARVQALLRERERLLREAQKKRAQLEQLKARFEAEGQELAGKMGPLMERYGALVAEVKALFDELARNARLGKRVRTKLGQLRAALELVGLLPPSDDDEDEGSFEPDDDDFQGEFSWADEDPPFAGRGSPGAGPGGATGAREVAGARQVGQEKRSLREIFRNLARAVHPDRAQHDADREQRSEVMKQVTQAYEEGDLARLIQLESAWQSQLVATEAGDPEARCRELERINRELLDQSRRLTRDIRDLKREARDVMQGMTPDEMVAGATSELEELQTVFEHLGAFRDGKITWAELERRTARAPASDELELLEAFLFEEGAFAPPRGRGSGRRGRK